jgi:hypothetical protein
MEKSSTFINPFWQKKHLADKALKAMYEVLKMGRMYKLSIKCLLDIFDKMIKPILLYGCKVWGFSNNDILEKIHLKFGKILLNLKTSTPSSCSSKNNHKIVEIFNYLNIHIIITEAQFFKRTRQRSTLVWKNQVLL